MTLYHLTFCTLFVGLMAGCGGGGSGATGSGGTAGMPMLEDPPAPAPSQTYVDLNAPSGTSALTGAILVGGTSVTGTSGTIDLGSKTFTATGINGSTSLSARSPFDLPTYTFARDIAVNSSSIAVIGASTAVADIRQTGSAAYTGDFSAQLGTRGQVQTTTLNWDADIQINFAGDGDVDMTFTGGGSDLIDTIRVLNAQISGNTFSGGTIRTSYNGTQNNITGTTVETEGAFFGYNNTLQLPGEIGGAIVSTDRDNDISGVFIASARP